MWEGYRGDQIEVIEPPITGRFVIDSVDWFGHLIGHEICYDRDELPSFAKKYITAFQAFCLQHNLLKSTDATSDVIYSDEFTEIGLDFMRQRYRWIKDQAIKKNKVATPEELEKWLNATRENRTDDEHWKWDRESYPFQSLHREGDTLPITFANYPGLQNANHLNFSGPRITDLNLLAKSLRLEYLILSNTAANDFRPLVQIPTLEDIWFYDMDLANVDFPCFEYLKSAQFNDVQLADFDSFEQTPSLNRLRLKNCRYDVDALEHFLQARPDVELTILWN